jgi:hypothetical protein
MAKKINYFARNFADVRTELVNFVRQYYPEIFNDFNDASVGMMILELNAAVGDMLSYHTDRMFQETQIDYAQERNSILSLARTYGLKIPGKRPSVTICDFTVTVPPFNDTFDLSYCPIIRRGAQVMGGGKVFESVDDIDFSSPFTTGGIPNRIIIPVIDNNQTITSYNITKRELVVNGTTKIYKKTLNETDVKPFMEVILPDNNVLSIDSVITLEGTNWTRTPTIDQFFAIDDTRWFEVDALAEDKVFIEDPNVISDNSGVKGGKFLHVDKRFITEFTNLGFIKLIFGAGVADTSSLCDFNVSATLIDRIGDIINNIALGEVPSPNKTMFVQYRIGGGADTNIGPNVLNKTGTVQLISNGSDQNQVNRTKASLKVNNPTPAIGGKDELSVEEIRYLIKYNFSAQNRAVTIKDYQSRITLMPGEFGVPFRCGVFEEQNKISVYVLGLDETGKLSNSTTSTMKQNLAEYLSDYRMLNDYVELNNGRVINLSFEIDLFVEKHIPRSQVMSEVINKVTEFMDINKHDMGENIYVSQLLEEINNVAGVLNVVDLRIYNKVGEPGGYSYNEISQPYSDETRRQIDLLGQYTLFGEPTGMFEVKYPDSDIIVRVKTT